MNKIISILIKAIKRMYRLAIYRKKVFGKIGKKNKFEWNCYISEEASIGNYNYVGPYVMLNNVSIQNYCSIGPGVKIGQGQHSIQYITTYNDISKNNINYKLSNKKTLVGNDVWFGANAVVMQGVKIGNGAVIGANAVVTKDVPDYAIVVGVPAEIKKYRFNSDRRTKITNSKWWELEKSEATVRVKELEGILNENITY